ncbi:hypothetical protein SAY86_010206 [Trapa natans]|uniref:Homeobox-DDT domain protein RLT3 n=1 Tax=Trapa natans TaxID=22666 RepID=A0AAN7KY63_TRANT|nr:hypothetical protein SAY86_010206 [Trapa natans]
MGKMKKTPLQLQALEAFYSEEKCPTPKAMEEYALALGLTLKQVQRWFVDKRRRDEKNNGTGCSPCSSKEVQVPKGRVGVNIASEKIRRQKLSIGKKSGRSNPLTSRCGLITSAERQIVAANGVKRPICLQDMLLTPEYILQKLFRKDGPPLGTEFDSLPAWAFKLSARSGDELTSKESFKKSRKRKDHDISTMDINPRPSSASKRHGMGKGLMTVWRATNPDGGDLPSGIDLVRKNNLCPGPGSRKPLSQSRRSTRQETVAKQKRLRDKLLEKKKPFRKKREVQHRQDLIVKPHHGDKCELALGSAISEEHHDQLIMQVDDEELELRELQAGPNSLSICDHLASDTLIGCVLCKDLLSKFPPRSVKMKQPFTMQPWNSSVEMVKKIFKAFHFLYTYSVILDINSFTVDEFAQAFYDKDSLLLGKIHVALLELLFLDIDVELSGGSLHHSNKSCKFLALIHMVENQKIILEYWKKFLNSLTWPEILRQVSVAAGFGSNQGSLQREIVDEELSHMKKYGLYPGTLKGELFRLLSNQGNIGLKVSEMARTAQIAELNTNNTTEELEVAIFSTLSSDIALFEKIASSTYRLRVNYSLKDGDYDTDREESGTVDDQHESGMCSSSENSECESEIPSNRKSKHNSDTKSRVSMSLFNGEIDESHPGEPWLLGLVEAEYSDLNIEEKLNALVALIDLLCDGCSIRMEEPTNAVTGDVLPAIYSGSGGKIKRPPANQQHIATPFINNSNNSRNRSHLSHDSRPVDSSDVMSRLYTSGKFLGRRKDSVGTESKDGMHPMQSIFLGSDRRYNRYWLFLGPCNKSDPGHRRIYFESSEDGHWRIIDTEEVLSALLSVLDERGSREGRLIESLDKRKGFISQAMLDGVKHADVVSVTSSCQWELEMGAQESSPISDIDNGLNLTSSNGDSIPSPGAIILEDGKRAEEQKRRWAQLQAFHIWTWHSYLGLNSVKLGKRSFVDSLAICDRCHDLYWQDEKHCKICHTTFELDFDLEERYAIHVATCTVKEADVFPKHKILPSRLQSLKAAVHSIEYNMPEGSMIGAWNKSAHRLWINRLRRISSVAELLQVLSDFIGAINRDWLFHCSRVPNCNIIGEEIVALFPTIPPTSSAVALWLVKLDALLANYLKGAYSNPCKKV